MSIRSLFEAAGATRFVVDDYVEAVSKLEGLTDRWRRSGGALRLAIGIDANTSLPAELEGMTGM